MPFITFTVKNTGFQMSMDDIFDNITNPNFSLSPQTDFCDSNDTRTVYRERVPQSLLNAISVENLTNILVAFNTKYKNLIDVEDKSCLYRSFKIPKHSGGLRQIDAPNEELMMALRELKFILERHFYASHHTAAFAYIKKRSPLIALKRHQANNSRWFLKLDFSNFFTKTSFNFLVRQLGMIFPFSEVVKEHRGRVALEKALSLCFLNGGLPQGTPISPILTNIMMIPLDLEFSRYARNHSPHLCYTRYADDLLVSSEFSFEWENVQKDLLEILERYEAPFTLKKEKTRYGSSAGRNWNLGLMLNKDNQITVGHQKKKQFKVMIYSLLNDFSQGKIWNLEDIQELQGIMAYYRMVEKEAIDKIVSDYEKKFERYGLKVNDIIKAVLLNS